MFKKILIANRGEIACRVIKTARWLVVTIAIVVAVGSHPSVPAAYACSPPPMEWIRNGSDLIVEGEGIFSRQSGGGTVAVSRVLKGRANSTVRVAIRYDGPRLPSGAACPRYDLKGKHQGTFYLTNRSDGRYNLLRFERSRP